MRQPPSRESSQSTQPKSREKLLANGLIAIDAQLVDFLANKDIDGMQRIFDQRRKLLDRLADAEQTPLESFLTPFKTLSDEFLSNIHGVGQ